MLIHKIRRKIFNSYKFWVFSKFAIQFYFESFLNSVAFIVLVSYCRLIFIKWSLEIEKIFCYLFCSTQSNKPLGIYSNLLETYWQRCNFSFSFLQYVHHSGWLLVVQVIALRVLKVSIHYEKKITKNIRPPNIQRIFTRF